MTEPAEFNHPLFYNGTKLKKDMSSVFGRPLVFKMGPLSEIGQTFEGRVYADVTEKEGRQLVKRFPELFEWPEATVFLGPKLVTREEFDALVARVEEIAKPTAPAVGAKKVGVTP